MARISWDGIGQRFFETGVDRGVLFVEGEKAVPWNGLISVDEGSDGGEPKPYYIDGVKYLNLASVEEFTAKLSAFYSPPEFDQCDGMSELATGLSVGQQKRKPFGLSYRTMIGNDIEGSDHGYKIHLIYNALASPSDRAHKTINDSGEAGELSWDLTTTPTLFKTDVFSAHMVINTVTAYPEVVVSVEEILYGTDTTEPRMPTPSEVVNIFKAYDDIVVIDNGDGTFTVQGRDLNVYMTSSTTFEINSDQAVMIDAQSYTLSSD